MALVLFSLMIGVRTEAGPTGQLIYWTRFGDLALMVGGVFVGSIVVELLRALVGPGRAPSHVIGPKACKARCRSPAASIAPLLLGFTFLVPVIFYDQRYILDLGILVLTYVMLGWGLNIVVGLAGLLDLGYVAFYAVGAYSYALLATNFDLSFWVCLPLAGILAAFWGVLLGFPVLRLRGDYLAIVTLAFGEIIRLVIINWQSLTGGPNGVSGIPRPTLFGMPLDAGRRRPRRHARHRILADPSHRVPVLSDPGAGAADQLGRRSGCGGCRSAAPGRRCARTRSPAARSASTSPPPSSPRSPSARCSAASPARSSRRGRASSRRNPSPSRNPRWCWRSSCSAAWARSSASRWRRWR